MSPRSPACRYQKETRVYRITTRVVSGLFSAFFVLPLKRFVVILAVLTALLLLVLNQLCSCINSSKEKKGKEKMSSSNLETRSLIDELRNFDKNSLFDLGHPLLNRIAESFVKAAGIGAVQAVAREAYFIAVEGVGGDTSGIPPEISAAKRHRFPDLRGETNGKTVEALVKGTGKESLQWGLAAGVYSGLTYGLKEARGVHDWKNSALAGAITGAALALTSDGHSHEQIVQCAITGAAISTAANLLTGIF